MDYMDYVSRFHDGTWRPKKTDDWALADDDGWSIAHVAAVANKLPNDFNQWELVDVFGVSVAHVLAQHHSMPKNFNHWDIRDNQGNTVAHVAAKHGHFTGRQHWDKSILILVNNAGVTVEDLVREFGNKKLDELKSIVRR